MRIERTVTVIPELDIDMLRRVRMIGIWATAMITAILSGCSSETCTDRVASKEDARRAINAFFSSDSPAARKLIAELQSDGMTDEYLEILRNGDLYAYIGESLTEDPDKWYVMASIAPPERKRSVALKIECRTRILLDNKYYGG